MRSKIRQLTKDSTVYGFGDIVSKAILFLLLPVYTRIFMPVEYGAIETLTILNNFLSIFLMMGLDAAQSFYFFEQKNSGKTGQASVVTAIIQWRLIWGSAMVVLATVLSPLLNLFLFEGRLILKYFVVAFSGALFVQFVGQSSEVFRLLYKPARSIGMTLAYVVVSSAISLLLIVCFRWGIMGYFAGNCIGAAMAAIFGLWLIRDYLDFSALHKEWWPRLIKFGAPFIFNGLAMYALCNADRWFIIHYHNQEVLGIYAVGSKFVIFISVAVNAFRGAFWPIAMDTLHSKDGARLFQTVSRLYLGLGIICIVALTSLSPFLMRFLSGPAYHSAYPIIGLLSWYAVFYGFFLIATVGIFKKEKTALLLIPMVIAVLINMALNICLVPQFAGIGAAMATSISFFALVLMTLIMSERLWPINYPIGILSLQIGTGIVACWRILHIYQNNLHMIQAGITAIIAFAILACTLLKYNQFIKVFESIKLISARAVK